MSVTNQFFSAELEMLQREIGKPCISIIAPLKDLSAGRKTDKLYLEKVIKAAKDKIILTHPEVAASLIESINNLYNEIDFDRTQDGIGFFVSTGFMYQTFFPFPVREKIVVDESFDLRDLLYKAQYSFPYYLLHLDEKKARLYRGKLKHLEEINSKDFPLVYVNEREYQPSSQSTSHAGYAHVKSFEHDKAGLEKSRFESFLVQVDELLDEYVKYADAIIVCGIKRYTSAFLNRTTHAEKIVTVINGNYNSYRLTELSAMAWPAIEAFVAEKMIDGISEFKENIGEGMAEEGIIPVWNAVAEGKGLTLLLEKDYQVQGFLEKKYSYSLYLKPPKDSYTILKDAVGQLIKRMLEKNGKIIFVENGMLRNHQQIALISRY